MRSNIAHSLAVFAIPAIMIGQSCGALAADAEVKDIDRATLDKWSAPYRGWHYQPDHVIPAEPKIPGHEKFHNPDVPTIYQVPGQTDKWYMSYIAFNGQGYNSFVVESTDLVKWTNPRLAMGFGKQGEFDFGGSVIGAYLYQSYAHKISLVYNPKNETFYLYYCACGNKGRGIGLITSKALGTLWKPPYLSLIHI